MISLDELNILPAPQFVGLLGGIFEHSPWVAERVAGLRPFGSRLALLEAMRGAVRNASRAEQLALIRAHPRLGLRGRGREALTQASSSEQRRAGLDACTPEEFERLEHLNGQYTRKFDFPFILAVRGHDPPSILASLERRLAHELAAEEAASLTQIGLIAGYRLADLVASRAETEILAMGDRLMRRLRPEGESAGALLREWLLAANLDLRFDAGGVLLGYQRGDRPGANTLLMGVHYDPTSRRLEYDGRLGCITAVAVVQQLREKGLHLPFDMAIVTRPGDDRAGDLASLCDPDALRGCVALSAMRAAGEEESDCLGAARATLLEGSSLAIVRQGHSGLMHRGAQPLDASLAARAAQTLEAFLLQGESVFPVTVH